MTEQEHTPSDSVADGSAADSPGVKGSAVQSLEVHGSDGAELTVAELRTWLRNWVAQATGQPAENIADDRPMEEFGLSSRDAIALGGEVEDLTGVMLTATVVYQHPTIASLASRIIEGEPDAPEESNDDSFYTSAVPAGESHDIAIVGLSTRFPHAGTTPEQTWEFLINGGDAITELPEGRWQEFTSDPEVAAQVAKANTRGGYLDDIKGFDAEFFAMSPTEVEKVDPQQRLALELTWEALEHARIPASSLKGTPVGVFIGSSSHDFTMLAAIDPNNGSTPYGLTGAASSIIANRVSYFYDFRGPSVAVDTACSSTLVAVHQAVRALRSGDADLALAGGTNTLLAPLVTLGFDSVGAVAKDGKIKAFSSDADGMVRSEGGGLVVLKRLEDAERDGDPILAVIAGSAVNSDGRSNGLLAPNPDAQADVLRRAYRDAGIAPSGVDYVDAHGTGTILGDPIEADALARVVGRGRDDDKPMLLGSAKTNFGHLESAAGAASLTKVVMAMQENKIPASINYAGPNPYIPFEKAHLEVVTEPTDWPRYTGTAVAGVSGFGFGGTNAHVVLKEYVPAVVDVEVSDEGAPDAIEQGQGAPEAVVEDAREPLPVVLVLSAYLPSRRRRAAADLADWLESDAGANTPLEDVGRALAKRNHGRTRAVVLARTHAEAVAGFRAVAAGKLAQGVYSADSPATQGAVWVLSGFGAQHRKMAKDLYLANAVFAKAIDEVDELILDEAGYSVKEMYLDDALDWDVGTSQVGIFGIQIGLAALLRHHGAEPSAVVGHSLGEVAGAYIAGGLALEDAVRVICARSRLMGEGESMLSGDAIRRMALVEYSAEEIVGVLSEYPDLEVAVYAAPTHTVIGGPEPQVEAIMAQAEAAGKMNRLLQTKGAGHTSQMDPLLGELAAELAGIEPTKLKHGVYSTVDKETYYRPGHEAIHGVDYWVKNMRHSVYFTNAVKQAVDTGHTTFLELAPNPVALMQVAATTFAAGLHNPQLIGTLKRKEDEQLGVLMALAQLYVHGHNVDIDTLFTPGDYADIPRTAFIRKPYWIDARLNSSGNSRIPGAHVALPDGRHVWEIDATAATDLAALVTAAATQVLSDVALGASIAHGVVPTAGTLTTTLNPHPGGASIQVHAKQGSAFTLLFDAVVTSGAELPQPVVAAPVAVVEEVDPEALPEVVETFGERWDPNGNQTLEDRLAFIVAESMGYAPEDIPVEIPLIELGLDSLMGVRIKNRVEYEFDIPQLQLQVVRDANLMEVAKYLRYAVENREEVQALADKQAAEKAAADAAAEGAVAEGAVAEGPAVEGPVVLDAAGEPVLAVEDTTVLAEAEAIVKDAAPEPAAPAAVLGGQQATAEAAGSDVPPRDAAERLAYATWAVVTGESAKGIFNTLPVLDDETGEKLAARLSERAKGEITLDDVLDAENIEALADVIRPHLEGGIDGIVRTLRARPEGATTTPVFVFHPSGGSTVAYEPLLKRLPADTPMYGFERVEGEIEDRARQYLPELRKIQGDGPYVLYGWSLGAVLAFAVAKLLRAEGADVRLVGMIDLALPASPPADGPEESMARMERYAAFAKTTYGVDAPLPVERLAGASEDEQIKIIMDLVKVSGVKIPGGVIEHQRTSFIDSRALANAQPSNYEGDVVLYLAERYHDGMIELEPAYKHRAPQGGWGPYLPKLEIVEVGGDHIQIIDEPYIAKIGKHLTDKLVTISKGN